MQHPDNLADHVEVVLWHLEPQVEGVDEVGTDLLAWDTAEVVIWLEEDLCGQWVSL